MKREEKDRNTKEGREEWREGGKFHLLSSNYRETAKMTHLCP
jgi:hypothetical protein